MPPDTARKNHNNRHKGNTPWVMLGAVLASSSATMNLGAAYAQTSANTDQGTPEKLQEVIVTATKRAVDITQVPISISALTQQDLDANGIKAVGDIAAITPGLLFTSLNAYGTPTTNISIRGVLSRDGMPTTAVYLDDTPLLARINGVVNFGAQGPLPQVFDLDRVEVLRGPQGTLFGASAEGGAVRFITREPSLTTHSDYIRSEFAYTKNGDPTYEAGAAVGGPLGDDGTLGFRASAWYRRNGGWIDRVQPLVGGPGYAGVNEANANWDETTAIKLAMTWAPIEHLRITPSFFFQNTNVNDSGAYEVAISNPSSDAFRFAHTQQLPASDPFAIPSLKVEADLGSVAMTSVTSYMWRHFKFQTDYTQYQDYAFFGSPYPLAPNDIGTGYYGVFQNNIQEELRFASTDTTSRISWVSGLYASSARQEDQAFVVHSDLPQLIQERFGQPIETVLGQPEYLGQYVAWFLSHTKDDQAAAFASADVRLVDGLKLTVGGRWAYLKTLSNVFMTGPFAGGTTNFAGNTKVTPFTPKASLNWQIDDNNLLYASAAKGYRVGGVNPVTDNPSPICQTALAKDGLTGKLKKSFDPDSLWSYELGSKNRLFGDRLLVESSVYYIKWSNIQQIAPIFGCGFPVTFNLGNAVSKGFDLQLQSRPTDHLKIGLTVGYTDAYFTETAGGFVTAGDQIGNGASAEAGPPWTGTLTAEYDWRLGSHDAYAWVQDIAHSKNTGPLSTQNPANVVIYDPALPADPSTNVVNLRVGMIFPNVDASLFVNNLLNTHPVLSLQHTSFGDPRFEAVTLRPLTVGVTVVYRPAMGH